MRFNWVELFLNSSCEIDYENNITFITIGRFWNIGWGRKLAWIALEPILRCALIENKVRIARKFEKELTGNILTISVTYTHASIKQNCDTIGLVKPDTKTLYLVTYGESLGKVGQYPSVFKSNQLHVDYFRILLINSEYLFHRFLLKDRRFA